MPQSGAGTPRGSIELSDGRVVLPDGCLRIPEEKDEKEERGSLRRELKSSSPHTHKARHGSILCCGAAQDDLGLYEEDCQMLMSGGSRVLHGMPSLNGGGTVLCGSIAMPDGRSYKPRDRRIQQSDGSLKLPDGRIQMPDGAIKMLNGCIHLQDGTWRQPLGSIAAQDGSFQMPDGRSQMPDGRIRMPNGTFQNPDGSLTMPNGSSLLLDGSFRMPDGSFRLPDGNFKLPDGRIQTPRTRKDAPDSSSQKIQLAQSPTGVAKIPVPSDIRVSQRTLHKPAASHSALCCAASKA